MTATLSGLYITRNIKTGLYYNLNKLHCGSVVNVCSFHLSNVYSLYYVIYTFLFAILKLCDNCCVLSPQI